MIITFVLLRRCGLRKPPFSRFSKRGATPIDDEEIATWRSPSQDMRKAPAVHMRNKSSVVFEPQTWKWEMTEKIGSPIEARPAIPYPAPVVARAPNARCGLTDEAIPGDAPYIKCEGRHSRRLSKATSMRQVRRASQHKSARSTSSAHSAKENRPSNEWREPDSWASNRKRSYSGGAQHTKKSFEGRTSMEHELLPHGGLSPRPYHQTPTPPSPPSIPFSHLPGSAL